MIEEAKVAVIGAGVTGLCAAHYLGEAFGRENVLVLEASDYVGGQTRTDHIDGFTCDWGPNGFLDREPLTLKWAEDLGLGQKMMRCNEAAAHRFILKNERLIEVIGPPKFLLTSLLSLKGRARLVCEPLIKGKKGDEPESIWNFAARRIGREAADMMVSPMVSGIFGGDAKKLSLKHCFPKMAAMERQYGSLLKALMAKKKENKEASPAGPAGTLTSFEGGVGALPARAAESLGDRIRTNTRVLRLTSDVRGFNLDTENGAINAEAVIIALPAYIAATICREMDDELGAALDDIEYADLAVLCTGYRRENVGHDLNGFGFLVPRNQGKRVLGSIWTSSVFSGRSPNGYVQLRTMYGGHTDPGILDLSDNELLDHLQREVHPIVGIDSPPEFVSIYRHHQGIPQYLMHHSKCLETIEAAEERFPGLVFAGNAYRGVGLNDCVLSAHRAVDCLTAAE